MLDPGSQDANVKTIFHFAFVVSVELLAQERGDVLRFDGVNHGFEQIGIDGLKVFPLLENDVGGILHLHQAPVICHFHGFDNRTILLGNTIQFSVDLPEIESFSDAVGQGKVGNIEECVFQLLEPNPF